MLISSEENETGFEEEELAQIKGKGNVM